MKNSPLTTVLLLILVVSALASVTLCWLYMSNVRQSRALQSDAVKMQNNQALVMQLAKDAVEYSKKNPAIDPLLESFNIKPKSAASTNKPPAK